MTDGSVLFLGGNGHCTARLTRARSALQQLPSPFALIDIPYPGFEGRPRASDLESFLSDIAQSIAACASGKTLVYGTGVGGLIALALRAGGVSLPILLQAPVLWGLRRRLLPRAMRFRPIRSLLRPAFSCPVFQSLFVKRQFTAPLPAAERRQFFLGYARGLAAPDLFHWLNPAILDSLENSFARCPSKLENIHVWWGAKDHVLSVRELRVTESALGVEWPLTLFPQWGHYPMIDDPVGWTAALNEVLHAA